MIITKWYYQNSTIQLQNLEWEINCQQKLFSCHRWAYTHILVPHL